MTAGPRENEVIFGMDFDYIPPYPYDPGNKRGAKRKYVTMYISSVTQKIWTVEK